MRYMLSAPSAFGGELDELFRKAVEVVAQYDRASAALLQRRLAIGYARAARLIDQLEAAGVITASDGSSAPRTVLVKTYEEYLEKGGRAATNQQEHIYQVPAHYKFPKNFRLSRADDGFPKQLSDVIDSKEYQTAKRDYPVILGYDSQGKIAITSLPKVGNLIVTGNPQSNKENWIDTALTTLLLSHEPKELCLILIDPTHYLDVYEGTPHLLAPVICDFEKAISALRWAQAEIDRRLKIFAQAGTRSLESYNHLPGIEPMQRILIVDFCDWMDDETTFAMARIASIGSRAGIHIFVICDRMGDKNLSPDIKANIPNRAVFAVTSPQDSRLAGVEGAEKLNEGEALLRTGNSDPKKLVTVYTPEINVKEAVQAVIAAGKR
jgi:DNA segregation ATPase FtsK/SpoIIIE-like protein